MASSHLFTKDSTLFLRSNLSNFRKCHSRSFDGIMLTEADYLFYAGNDIDQKSIRHPFQISGPGGRCLMKKIKKGINSNHFAAHGCSVHTTALSLTMYPGPRKPYEIKPMTEGLFARVDLPGVGEGEAEVFVGDNTVVFKALAREEAGFREYHIPRVYMGSFNLFFGPNHTCNNIRTEVKHGVLRFLIPATCFSDYPSPPSTLIFTNPLPHSSEDRKENPFQRFGMKGSHEKVAAFGGDAFRLRVDIPGVEQDEMDVFFDEEMTTMYFRGKAPEEWEEFDQDGRSYFGSFSLRCGCCNISNVTFNSAMVFSERWFLRSSCHKF